MKYILFILCIISFSANSAEPAWPAESLKIFEIAKQDESFKEVEKLHPQFYPTSDGMSFFTVWKQSEKAPNSWIISLPGTHGLATKDLSIWSRHLLGRNIGLITMQWWLGTGDKTKDYLTPREIYRNLDIFLNKMGIKGKIMLQGFSRGSSNIYAVAALDSVPGKKYFNLFVANAGGASLDYPPTAEIVRGVFGKQPFAGTKWATSCGAKDQNIQRDGCTAMQRTGEWLKSLGANLVLKIEDPNYGHGALHLNPQNTKLLLDYFEKN